MLVYPNPFNESTTVAFENPTNENCSLTLYNAYGQIVQEIDGITSGKAEIKRLNMVSGLYFLQLRTTNKISATSKLIIE